MISVIIPVYNTEKYIRECLDSLLCQTCQDLEVLLIDDGSTDGSGRICDEYQKREGRIRVFHQKNSGVSAARNCGLREARGEYIFFLDADDILGDDKLLESLACDSQMDLVMCGYQMINENGKEKRITQEIKETELSSEQFLHALFHEKEYGYLGFITPKLFKKEIIDQSMLFFDESIRYNEDRLFITRYLLNCKKTKMIENYGYYYREHENSAMGQLNKKPTAAVLTELLAFEKMKELVKADHPQIYYRICRLIYERSLFWLKRIDEKPLHEQARQYLFRNAGLCLKEPGKSFTYRIKILLHCIRSW